MLAEAFALVGLVGGNILIQATTERGSQLLVWPWLTFVAAWTVVVVDVVLASTPRGAARPGADA